MAHSALVSLMNTLELILHSDRFHFFHVKQQVITLYRKVRFLQRLFQDSLQKSSEEEMNLLEIRIRDSAYSIEDLVEYHITGQILSDPESFIARLDSVPGESSPGVEHQELEAPIEEIDLIVEELLKDRCGLKDLLPRKYLPVCSSRTAHIGNIEMVGLNEDVMELKDRLTGQESKLQAIPIAGMGGIGKTTLARNLYDDLLVKYHFDVRAWVTISQTYLARNVLQGLLKDIGVSTSKQQENSIQELTQILYKNLKGRRYLIVLDDLWNTDVWDDLKRIFPDDGNGSRVMLTTRLVDVAIYATDCSSPPHQMQLLDKSKSWDLLCQRVFGQDSCPPELVDIGKMIARNCRGLPLATTVIGGLLANSSMTREFWEYVAENVNSLAIKSDEHCSEILSLSYNNLPHHLKPCFLYFGAFPEDHEISVTNLIRLWIAEGFLKPIRSKGLEEAAEEYLNDLIYRNLVFVRRKRYNGKTKTCIIHDLLRDLCIKEAQKENFLHIVNRSVPFSQDGLTFPSRLIMLLDNLKDSDITDDMSTTMESIKLARSLLCTGYILAAFPFYQCFRLLRVLDLLRAEFSKFPFDVLSLVNLRYLALSFCRFPIIPSEISLLWKLQILIIQDQQRLLNQGMFPDLNSWEIDMPLEILQMAQLRHLQFTECFVSEPIDGGNNSVVLRDLETLSTVANFRCTEEVLKKFPNLRKLSVCYYRAEIKDWSDYHLENLVHLSKLENLKCIFNWPPNDYLLRNLIFPQSLRKLTLCKSRLLWKDMTIIGSLPLLEVLKLKEYAFVGALWEPTEGEFCQLKFLLIHRTNLVQWIADHTHFPRLEHLTISWCSKLQEIPSCIGEIATLKMIEIDEISPSAASSAEQILEEQQSLENYVLQVRVHRSFLS